MPPKTHFLLFSAAGEYLGDVLMRDGAYDHITLTDAGERAHGAAIAAWQTEGIPVRAEIHGKGEKAGDIAMVERFVPLTDDACMNAFRMWCEDHRLMAVLLPSSVHLECWQMLMRLPLIPPDRFRMIASIVRADAEQFITWQQLLGKALTVAKTEYQKHV